MPDPRPWIIVYDTWTAFKGVFRSTRVCYGAYTWPSWSEWMVYDPGVSHD